MAIFNVVTTVDTVDEEGNPVPAGTVVNHIVGEPDGNGGVKNWTPPDGTKAVLTQS